MKSTESLVTWRGLSSFLFFLNPRIRRKYLTLSLSVSSCFSKTLNICYFITTPIYTLKGRYQKTPEIERSYYMLINRTHQLAGFNGLRKRTSILPYSNEKWSIKETNDGKDQLLLRDKQSPIGRTPRSNPAT